MKRRLSIQSRGYEFKMERFSEKVLENRNIFFFDSIRGESVSISLSNLK